MISLFRIDDRLIHGQVVIGWGIKLNPDQYVIIDDDLEDWEADLYLGCLEDESKGLIVNTDEAAKSYQEWIDSRKHIVILVKSPTIIEKLISKGVHLDQINLGGLHYLEGKKQYLNCLYLYDEECETLKRIINDCHVSYQPLPSDHKVDLKTVLR
jgi:mannose/fructose/N-acetylgalactosamine-specific phosphotransferase system component IIB